MRTLAVIFVASALHGADLLQDDFAAPGIPKHWTPGGRPGSWSVVNGTLQGDCSPQDDHGPSISTPITVKNLTLDYRLRREPGAYALMLIDGDSVFGGQAHLLRVAVAGDRLTIAQDRGSPKSKAEQAKAKADAKAAKQPAPKPTTTQLADPWFYRTEQLAATKLKTKPGDWIKIEVIVHQNSVTVTIDDKQMVTAKATVLDVPKSKIVFLAGMGKKLWIDDVRLREAK